MRPAGLRRPAPACGPPVRAGGATKCRLAGWPGGPRLRRRAAAPAHLVPAESRVGRPRGRPAGASGSRPERSGDPAAADEGVPAGLPVLELPRELPDPGVPATAVLAGGTAPARPLDAAQLGRVLFLGAGVVRTAERDGRPILFRAAGSAGARFPLEVYASTRGVEGVPDGVHWYDAARHALVQVGPAAEGAATTLVVTGVPWRTGWRYAERGWRHLVLGRRHAAVPARGGGRQRRPRAAAALAVPGRRGAGTGRRGRCARAPAGPAVLRRRRTGDRSRRPGGRG